MEHPQDIVKQGVTTTPESPGIWLKAVVRRNGLMCSDEQVDRVKRFVELLKEKNQGVNLISRRDVDQVWESHILHSLGLLFRLKLVEGVRILDLGTGGGLPGIPLAIVRPDIEIVMIDATKKKIVAVQSMIDQLELGNATALWGRAEELGRQPALQAKFDHVLARAVGPLDELVRLSEPFLKRVRVMSDSLPTTTPAFLQHRTLVAYKGGALEDELRRTRQNPNVTSVEVLDLVFKGSERFAGAEKKLVVVRL